MQRLAGVLLPTAAVAQALYLKVVPLHPATLSPALMFSIREDHKLLSAVITAVHRGCAEGTQLVRLHPLTFSWHRGSRQRVGPASGPSQRHTVPEMQPLRGPRANESD